MNLRPLIPATWQMSLAAVDLKVVETLLETEPFQPELTSILRVLSTDPKQVKVVILGQDPYPGLGVPTGLAFDVGKQPLLPASLRNIFTEYCQDLGLHKPDNGDLAPWARQGVFLLNTALTCQPGHPGSQSRPWLPFTSAIVAELVRQGALFVVWGNHARAVACAAQATICVSSSHPSPLSARRGSAPFIGSRPFSAVNQALATAGREEVNWRLS